MAWNKAGSKQIQDNAILSNHISTGVVTSTHLAAGAVKDTHIDIDWASKATAILATKKVVDYVQAPAGVIAAGSSSINLSGVITLGEAATDNDLGVVVTTPNNKVVLTEKGDSSKLLIDEETGAVIYGRIEPGLGVTFFIFRNGNESLYTFANETEYNLQFPARFTLDTVSEMFATNEKFVDGAADVTTRLDVAQVVADVFGDTYALNKDGQATVADGKTIVELISAVEASVNTNTGDITAIELILSGTEENPASGLLSKVTAAEGKVSAMETKVTDAEAKVSAAEGNVSTLQSDVSTLQSDVETLKTSASAPDLTAEVDALEVKAEALTEGVNNLSSEVSTLKSYDVDTRLTIVEHLVQNVPTGDGTSTQQYRFDKKADADATEYTLVDIGVADDTRPLAATSDLYINGMLQMLGEHFTEASDGAGYVTTIVFNPNVVNTGDIVQLRWTR